MLLAKDLVEDLPAPSRGKQTDDAKEDVLSCNFRSPIDNMWAVSHAIKGWQWWAFLRWRNGDCLILKQQARGEMKNCTQGKRIVKKCGAAISPNHLTFTFLEAQRRKYRSWIMPIFTIMFAYFAHLGRPGGMRPSLEISFPAERCMCCGKRWVPWLGKMVVQLPWHEVGSNLWYVCWLGPRCFAK